MSDDIDAQIEKAQVKVIAAKQKELGRILTDNEIRKALGISNPKGIPIRTAVSRIPKGVIDPNTGKHYKDLDEGE